MALFYPTCSVGRVTEITPGFMEALGIRALVLDVDNTLTTHDNPHPFQDIAVWLEEMKAQRVPMLIVSNNNPERVRPFAEILGLPFVADGAKPLAKGFREAAARLGLPPREIGVVGDQIFTDILGGNLFGAKTVLVQPLGPETKNFIKFKRKLERVVLVGYRPGKS